MLRDFNKAIQFFEFDLNMGLGIVFPTRTSIVRLKDRKALVISPGPFDEEIISYIKKSFTTVAFVAPNAFHHLFLAKTRESFPNAKIFAPDGVFKKQKKIKSELTPIQELKEFLGDQVLFEPLAGNPGLDEYYFWHKESKTLILTDLFFHMKEPMPKLRRWLLKLMGAYNKPAQSKLVKILRKDKESFQKATRDLVKLEAESIVIAHGEPMIGLMECRDLLNSL